MSMEMVGEARLPAARDRVWEALNDPAILKVSIPGCEALERSGENAFTATVVSKVGPIKARFSGKVTLSNIVPPRSYTLSGEGTGGAAGFARADIEVALEALEPQLTLLRYSMKATVGGKLAQLGSRMVDAAARKMAEDFFVAFGREVGRGEAEVATPEAQDLQSLAGAVVPELAPAAVPLAAAADAPAAWAAPIAALEPPLQGLTTASIPVATADAADVLNSGLIKVWIADQIAVVTLNRPGHRNAMTLGMWQAVPGIFDALGRNAQVRSVILTGAGGDFCAGADITEFETVRDDPVQSNAYEVAVDACCDAIANLAKPTIAVIKGYCLGGGAHLAMSCDFRHADAQARFGIPAARLSIIYGVRGTRKLLSLVGLPQAKKILFGAQPFSASEALTLGFVDKLSGLAPAQTPSFWSRWLGKGGSAADRAVPSDVMADARAFASAMAANAPLSVAGAKAMLNGMAMGMGALHLEQAQALMAAAAASEDYREGRAAFAAKRPPQFKGR